MKSTQLILDHSLHNAVVEMWVQVWDSTQVEGEGRKGLTQCVLSLNLSPLAASVWVK